MKPTKKNRQINPAAKSERFASAAQFNAKLNRSWRDVACFLLLATAFLTPLAANATPVRYLLTNGWTGYFDYDRDINTLYTYSFQRGTGGLESFSNPIDLSPGIYQDPYHTFSPIFDATSDHLYFSDMTLGSDAQSNYYMHILFHADFSPVGSSSVGYFSYSEQLDACSINNPNHCGASIVGFGYAGQLLISSAPPNIPPSTRTVPEPETYAMLLAGLGLLGYMTRRRKQKAA